jgi:hypothetical protein
MANHPPFFDAIEPKIKPDDDFYFPWDLGGTNHNIGHTNVHLSCGGRDIWTGITSDDSKGDLEREAFFSGAALEVMLDDIPGRELSAEEIHGAELDFYLSNTRMNALRFQINASQCQRMLEFYDGYKRRRLDHVFGGLAAEARHGQGVGCTPYALSFLDSAGLVTPEFRASIYRRHCIPHDIINYPGHPARISLMGIALPWVDAHFVAPDSPEPHLCIEYGDPELGYKYVTALYEAALTPPKGLLQIHAGVAGRTARVVELDARAVPPATGPVFIETGRPLPRNSNPLNPNRSLPWYREPRDADDH